MSPGDSNTFGGYNFKYIDYTNEDYPDRDESIAYFQVESNGKSIGVLTPFRAFYPQFRIAATRGAIKSTPKEDFYIVPSQFEDDGSGVFRVLINPMIWWMWVSAPVIIFGTLFSLFPYRRKAKNSVQFTE
jgi:cytochrome c biogenesis factor